MERKFALALWLSVPALTAASLWGTARWIRHLDEKRSAGTGELKESTAFTPRGDVTSADGTRIHAEHGGEGPAVFLVHGFTCDNSIWRYQKAFLSRRFRVVAMDLRGHGRSGIPKNGDHSVERLAEDLQAVLEAYGPKEFVLVGHSMGGFTILKWQERFAGGWHGRLKGIALINTSALPLWEGIILGRALRLLYPLPLSPVISFFEVPRPVAQKAVDAFWGSDLGYLFMRYIAFGKRPSAREVDFQRRLTASTPLFCFARSARACLEYRLDPSSLKNIDVPVLVVGGTEDRLTGARVARRTAELIPHSRLVIYNEKGHDTLLECPEEVNRELDAFISECLSK